MEIRLDNVNRMSEKAIRERLKTETDAYFASANADVQCPVLSWDNCYIIVREKISKELDEKDAALVLSMSTQPEEVCATQ